VHDQVYYDRVAEEIRNGKIKEGLWTKAFSIAYGNESVAKSHYISLRVKELTRLTNLYHITGTVTNQGRSFPIDSKVCSKRSLDGAIKEFSDILQGLGYDNLQNLQVTFIEETYEPEKSNLELMSDAAGVLVKKSTSFVLWVSLSILGFGLSICNWALIISAGVGFFTGNFTGEVAITYLIVGFILGGIGSWCFTKADKYK
jgi:hypothetical protein